MGTQSAKRQETSLRPELACHTPKVPQSSAAPHRSSPAGWEMAHLTSRSGLGAVPHLCPPAHPYVRETRCVLTTGCRHLMTCRSVVGETCKHAEVGFKALFCNLGWFRSSSSLADWATDHVCRGFGGSGFSTKSQLGSGPGERIRAQNKCSYRSQQARRCTAPHHTKVCSLR